jgi:SPP1 family predicted phage head-tail adaptor
MGIGKMRERITIEEAIETADSEGHPVKDWEEFLTTWAQVEGLTGGEYESVKMISSKISKRFTVNHRTDITLKMRIMWSGVGWNIHDIQPDERKFEMKIYASRDL